MYKINLYKLNSSALQFVVYIVIVIAILLSMLLLYIHLNQRFIIQSDTQIQAIELANNGVFESLEKKLVYNDTLVSELTNEYENLKLFKEHWGAFDLIQSFAHIRDKKFSQVALIGGKTPYNNDLALYLQDNNQALVLVGDTKISGNSYLGAYGAKAGQISGNGYMNNQLIYGDINRSNLLPKIATEKSNYIRYLNKQILNNKIETFEFNAVNVLNRSFFKPTLFDFSNQMISLYEKNYSGKVILQSNDKIYVDASSKLKNIILIAPEIVIGSNFEGSLQAFARKNIKIESGVDLKYPSALILNPLINSVNKSIPQIEIESTAKINGVVAYLEGNDSQLKKNNFSHINIEKNAEVNGQVFCNYNLKLNGEVNGHVITNQFLTPFRGSYYINHIFNAKITSDPVSNDFSGIIFKSSTKAIVSWLN